MYGNGIRKVFEWKIESNLKDSVVARGPQLEAKE
jgi:hypothetical protein